MSAAIDRPADPFVASVFARAKRDPEDVAVWHVDRGAWRAVANRDLVLAVCQRQAALIELGVNPHSLVAINTEDPVETLVSELALRSIGADIVLPSASSLGLGGLRVTHEVDDARRDPRLPAHPTETVLDRTQLITSLHPIPTRTTLQTAWSPGRCSTVYAVLDPAVGIVALTTGNAECFTDSVLTEAALAAGDVVLAVSSSLDIVDRTGAIYPAFKAGCTLVVAPDGACVKDLQRQPVMVHIRSRLLEAMAAPRFDRTVDGLADVVARCRFAIGTGTPLAQAALARLDALGVRVRPGVVSPNLGGIVLIGEPGASWQRSALRPLGDMQHDIDGTELVVCLSRAVGVARHTAVSVGEVVGGLTWRGSIEPDVVCRDGRRVATSQIRAALRSASGVQSSRVASSEGRITVLVEADGRLDADLTLRAVNLIVSRLLGLRAHEGRLTGGLTNAIRPGTELRIAVSASGYS